MSLSQDQMQSYAEKVQNYINSILKELRRLFLVQDLVDSLKVLNKENTLLFLINKCRYIIYSHYVILPHCLSQVLNEDAAVLKTSNLKIIGTDLV